MRKYYKNIVKVFLAIMLLFNISYSNSYQEVKVGYYNIKNEMEEDSFGNKSGYNYYYLQQIKKYSNLKYKYVFGTWYENLENLKSEKIDLLIGIIKTKEREKFFDFSKYSVGILEGILIAPIEKKIDYNSFNKIGVLKGEALGEKYREIMEVKKIKDELVYYDSYDQLWEDFYNNNIDMVLTYSSTVFSVKDKKIKIVDYFDLKFSYIAVKKGNKKLLNEINNAIKDMKIYNKDLINKFKYNSIVRNEKIPLLFDKEEEKKLKSMKKLTFISYNNRGYFAYDKNEKQRGIDYDVAKLISEKLGLDLDYKVFYRYLSPEEMEKYRGDVIFSGNYFDLNWAEKHNINLTSEYLKSRYYKVMKNNGKKIYKKNMIVAAVKGSNLTQNFIEKNYDEKHIYLVSGAKEVLDAIYLGKADVGYFEEMVGDYYLENYKYRELYKEYIPYEKMLSFALLENSSAFASLINKTIASIEKEEISEIILKNLSDKPKNNPLFRWIYFNFFKAIILVVMVVGLLIQGLYCKKIRNKNKIIRKITDLAQKDSLTKLYNRETFKKIVSEIMKEKNCKSKAAFIMVDIDFFKEINDKHGHFLGDQVIMKITNLLKNNFSESDIIGRMGGDEFAILLDNYENKNYIDYRIQKLIKEINFCMENEKEERSRITVKCSFGIAFIPKHGKTFEEIYKAADTALYRAKAEGKNKYIFFS